MPTYLLHGFRWYRISIRQYVATYDVDDCAPDWVVAPAASYALLNSLYSLYDFIPPCQQPTSHSTSSAPSTNGHSPTRAVTAPSPRTPVAPPVRSPSLLHPRTANGSTPRLPDAASSGFNSWSPIKLLEQHDPFAPAISEPYAFVGDAIIRVPLSADISAEIAAYEAAQVAAEAGRKARGSAGELRRAERQAEWITKLGAKLEPKETVGWFVVVCGDEQREFGELKKKEEAEEEEREEVRAEVRKERRGFRRLFSGRDRADETESRRISKVKKR